MIHSMPLNFFRRVSTPPAPPADETQTLLSAAAAAAREGHRERALEIYRQVLERDPEHAVAAYKIGNLYRDLGQIDAALASYDRALIADPNYAYAHCNRGVVLASLGRFDAAVESYERAIALNPQDSLAFYNRGAALRELDRDDAALASYDAAIELNPAYAEAHSNRAVLLMELERWDESLAGYDRSLAIFPNFAAAYFNRGVLHQKRRRWDLARRDYDRALELDPAYVEALCNRGVLLTSQREWDLARQDFDRALALRPTHAEGYAQRGNLYLAVHRHDSAIGDFARALEIDPENVSAHTGRANTLLKLKDYGGAILAFDRACTLDPDIPYLLGTRRFAKMMICDWSGFEDDVARLIAGLEADDKLSPPMNVMSLIDAPSLQYRAACLWSKDEVTPPGNRLECVRSPRATRIHLGYFSADFDEHPVSLLLAELLEGHDRSRFEITAFSFGQNSQSGMRKRMEGAFERFIDVGGRSDQEVAALARELHVDLAIDLGGHTANCRTGIFALGAAPIQATYLGYPGTMGARYYDYLIADPVVIPPDQRRHYQENIVYLPASFMPHDSGRVIADTTLTRSQLGLPAKGFVFCCFNASYKITPPVFDVWTRILRAVDRSVLWLSRNNPTAMHNLCLEAERRGIDPARLIFADRLPSAAEHLARHRSADLFLDTTPYNAHTTAMDALWAGLPVLTHSGNSFASRVANSLLTALNLPELITTSAAAYEARAIHLATHPEELTNIRNTLAQHRQTTPLFDTNTQRKRLETAYEKMFERQTNGYPPADIVIDLS